MSCPDWNDLTDHRRGDAAEPEGWSEAVTHLDECAACRERATAADPTLIFRRLPTVDAGADEIAAMRAGVAAMRRAGRVAEPARSALRTEISGPHSSAGWGRVAAAAVLAAGLLSLQPGLDRRPADALATSVDTAFEAAPDEALSIALLEEPGAAPVDDILSPYASVYHLGDEELAVVMVVDPDLDV